MIKLQATSQNGADRRQPFCFRERVGETGIAGFAAAAAHLERSAEE